MSEVVEVKKPSFVTKGAARLWRKYAPSLTAAGKLTDLSADMFGTWCCLMAEFQKGPELFQASRLTQMRLYARPFGLMPEGPVETEGEKSDPAEQYFEKPAKPRLVKGA